MFRGRLYILPIGMCRTHIPLWVFIKREREREREKQYRLIGNLEEFDKMFLKTT